MTVKFAKTSDKAHLPIKAHPSDAGADCYVCLDCERVALMPHKTEMMSLGFKMEMPEGYCGLLFPRSGMGKIGVNLGNCVGVIDAAYRGEVKALIHNDSDEIKTIEDGTRVCQLMIVPVIEYEVKEITEEQLTDTDRGEDGFGSSGTK